MRCPAFSTATRLPGQVLSGGYHGPGGNGNRHRHHGHGGNGHAKKVMKRRKSHMKQGRNRAACAAYGAVLLIQKCGFTIEAAIGTALRKSGLGFCAVIEPNRVQLPLDGCVRETCHV